MRALVQGSTVNTTVRNQWGLARRADRFGNQMNVTYREPSGLLPDTISYTANPSTGRLATKTIKFNYQVGAPSRAGISRMVSGVNVNNGGLVIKSIEALAPNPHLQSVVTAYKMSYGTPSITHRALLTRIQRCDGPGVCMAPTIISWDPGSYLYSKVATDLGNAALPLVAGDFDGDGHDDLVYRTHIDPNTPFDENALAAALRNTSIKLRRFGSRTGFGPEQDMGVPSVVENPRKHRQDQGSSTSEWITAETNTVRPPTAVDLNGDGRSDLVVPFYFLNDQVVLDREIFSRVRVDMFQAGIFGTVTPLPPGANPDLSNLDDPSFNPEAASLGFGELLWADLNGDGLLDFTRKLIPDPNGIVGTAGVRLNENGAMGPYRDTGLPLGEAVQEDRLS